MLPFYTFSLPIPLPPSVDKLIVRLFSGIRYTVAVELTPRSVEQRTFILVTLNKLWISVFDVTESIIYLSEEAIT